MRSAFILPGIVLAACLSTTSKAEPARNGAWLVSCGLQDYAKLMKQEETPVRHLLVLTNFGEPDGIEVGKVQRTVDPTNLMNGFHLESLSMRGGKEVEYTFGLRPAESSDDAPQLMVMPQKGKKNGAGRDVFVGIFGPQGGDEPAFLGDCSIYAGVEAIPAFESQGAQLTTAEAVQ